MMNRLYTSQPKMNNNDRFWFVVDTQPQQKDKTVNTMTLSVLTWSHVKCTVKVLLRLRFWESEFSVRSFSSHLNVVLV